VKRAGDVGKKSDGDNVPTVEKFCRLTEG